MKTEPALGDGAIGPAIDTWGVEIEHEVVGIVHDRVLEDVDGKEGHEKRETLFEPGLAMLVEAPGMPVAAAEERVAHAPAMDVVVAGLTRLDLLFVRASPGRLLRWGGRDVGVSGFAGARPVRTHYVWGRDVRQQGSRRFRRPAAVEGARRRSHAGPSQPRGAQIEGRARDGRPRRPPLTANIGHRASIYMEQ